jgi:hypothetical protein
LFIYYNGRLVPFHDGSHRWGGGIPFARRLKAAFLACERNSRQFGVKENENDETSDSFLADLVRSGLTRRVEGMISPSRIRNF